MSYFVVNIINHDGTIIPHKYICSALAFNFFIWQTLSDKYLDGVINFYHRKEFPKLFKSKVLPKFEKIVLGMTFDGVWIKKENFNEIINALHKFRRNVNSVALTLDLIKQVIKDLLEKDIRGICFHHDTSINNFWLIKSDSNKDILQYFNFDNNKEHPLFNQTFELFGDIDV